MGQSQWAKRQRREWGQWAGSLLFPLSTAKPSPHRLTLPISTKDLHYSPTATLALANSLETHLLTCPGVSLNLLEDSKSSQVDHEGKQSQWPYLPPNIHGDPIPISMIISACVLRDLELQAI